MLLPIHIQTDLFDLLSKYKTQFFMNAIFYIDFIIQTQFCYFYSYHVKYLQ